MSTVEYRRHALIVRLTHWINVAAVVVLLMSGLQIFNAHPALNWGKSSYDGSPPALEMSARYAPGNRELVGVTRIGGAEFRTTGLLGVSSDPSSGNHVPRGFPSWLTLPGQKDLAMGRRWHFFFAWLFVLNGLVYVSYTVASRHRRELAPTRRDWRGIGQSIKDHLLFRHPHGEAARDYNVLQKLAYLIVIFVLLPLIILMGLAMSPGVNSVWPGWVDLFGGRQSARTLHFIAAWLLVLFVLIHVFQVLITGVWNNLRSMITGKYRIEVEQKTDEAG